MPETNLKRTIIGCIIMMLLTIPRHNGFIIIFFLLFLIPSLSIRLTKVYFNKIEKNTALTSIGIWSVAIAVSIFINVYRHYETRREANTIVSHIEKYKDQYNEYPSSINEVGITKQELRDKLGPSSYSTMEGKPFFYYAAPYVVFDTYEYDFDSSKWVYHGD